MSTAKKTSDFSIIEPYPAAPHPTISIEPIIYKKIVFEEIADDSSEESTREAFQSIMRMMQQTLDSNLEVMTDLQNRMNGMENRLRIMELTTQSIIKDFADMNQVKRLNDKADEMHGTLVKHQNEIKNMQNVLKDVFDILYDKK